MQQQQQQEQQQAQATPKPQQLSRLLPFKGLETRPVAVLIMPTSLDRGQQLTSRPEFSRDCLDYAEFA
jgi:hypothetical protein